MLERRTRRAPVEPALKYPMPRALLIFVGLLRTMEVTFPAKETAVSKGLSWNVYPPMLVTPEGMVNTPESPLS